MSVFCVQGTANRVEQRNRQTKESPDSNRACSFDSDNYMGENV